jgi:hypothetical protein
MEIINTNRFTHNSKQLYIIYKISDGKMKLFLNTEIPKEEEFKKGSYKNLYGYIIIHLKNRICDGIYIDSFYINYDKYPEDNLRGLGKFMLCTSISVLIKNNYSITKICLNAYSTKRDSSFFKEIKNWSGKEIIEYIISKDLQLYYNTELENYVSKQLFNEYKINYLIQQESLYDAKYEIPNINKLAQFIDTYKNDENDTFKMYLCEELSRLKNQEKLLEYYKSYGFKKSKRNKYNNFLGVFMLANLQDIHNNCLKIILGNLN